MIRRRTRSSSCIAIRSSAGISKRIDNPYQGLLETVCQQHSFNFLLWHEEDVARSPDVADSRIAQVKRAIDGYNQQRNDWIERIDDWIRSELVQQEVVAAADAPLNTETPGQCCGSPLDPLVAFVPFAGTDPAGRCDTRAYSNRWSTRSLSACSSRTTYRRLCANCSTTSVRVENATRPIGNSRMYNDPTLNPYLYQAKKRLAG